MMMENKIDNLKEMKEAIQRLLDMLDENGWELNDDGDIVEKSTKRLVWDVIHNIKE